MKLRSRVTLAVAAAASLALPGLAHAAPVQRPNPIFVSPVVDYVSPIQSSSGGVAQLPPLEPAVIQQAVGDQDYLSYQRRDDLGGFVPAPIGQLALSSGGRNVVGAGAPNSQIPQFAQAASGSVQSFAFTGGPSTTPPQNGTNPVPGLGTPPPVTPPTNTNTVPPPNQGFGGNPPPPTTTTSTTTRPRPPTTTSPPPPPPSSCGTIGLSIVVDKADCRIYAVNMAPGDSASERVTITNQADQAFTLSLRALGTQNRLWNGLQMGVWQVGTAAPSPLPALLLWTTQQNPLTTLQPGQSITYEIELYLPPTAGNDDQGLAATIDFNWEATG